MHQMEGGLIDTDTDLLSNTQITPKSEFKFHPDKNLTSTPKGISTESQKDNNLNNNNNTIFEANAAISPPVSSSVTATLIKFPSIEKRRNSNVFTTQNSVVSPQDGHGRKMSSSFVSSSRNGSVDLSASGTGSGGLPGLTFTADTPPALPSVPPPTFSIGKSALNFKLNTKLMNGSGDGSQSHSSSGIMTGDENLMEYFPDHHNRDPLFYSASENTSLQYRDPSDLSVPDISGTGGLPFKRNTVHRTSLRKSPQHTAETMGHRRWGSFRNTSGTKRPVVPVTSSSALASQLYRSSSFHSSGRSSAGDGEEMYSDGSLEDEVIDLTQKVHHLEEKFTVLAENQSDVDDRYTRAKAENAEIATKLFMVEEQLRDCEQRSEERLREEQRRFKDTISRLEREKQLQIENCGVRLQSLEKDLELSKSESVRLRQQLDRERSGHEVKAERLVETERELCSLRDQNRDLLDQSRKERECLVMETSGSQQALLDLKREVESMRRFQMANSPNNALSNRYSIDEAEPSELKSRLFELEEENKRLKQQNRELKDANDDLSAQLLNQGLEDGLQLLTLNNSGIGNSLAAEFEAMSQDQSPNEEKPGFGDIFGTDLSKVKNALKEQKEVNDKLRTYIDGILLNIVENYPQLLEVKNKCVSPKY